MKTILLILSFSFITLSAQQIVEVVYYKGDVTLDKVPLSKVTKFSAKKVLRTGPKSIVVLKLNYSRVKLGPNSEFTLDSYKKDQTSMNLNKGESFVQYFKNKVNKDVKHDLKFKTKTASMGVRGTTFYVAYGKGKKKKDDTWMCVKKGKVAIAAKKDEKPVIVNSGEGVVVQKEEKKGKIKGKDIVKVEMKMSKPRKLAWTKKLNWNLDPKKDLVNKVNIEEAYYDLLDQDYD